MYEYILVLEEADLNAHNVKNGNIGVDKTIFDNFVKNAMIQIRFIDDYDENHVHTYKMIFEDDNTIFMQYLWDEFI